MVGLWIRLTVCVLVFAGCGDQLSDAAPGTGDPSADPGGRVVVPGTGGAGGAGGNGGGGAGGSLGACDNAADLAVLLVDDPAPNATTFCGGVACINATGSVPAYQTCVSGCIETEVPGLSTECADCYGDLYACGLSGFCLSVCQVGSCSVPCLNCLDFNGCLDQFADCRGLTASVCP